jgi:hypothetical protein
MALIERTGRTQGMIFRIIPPRKAKKKKKKYSLTGRR